MGVSDKERRLAETLRDPVLWGQAYLYNRDGSARSYWDHQKEDLRCSHKNIIHLDGRDVGKSIVLSCVWRRIPLPSCRQNLGG